MTITNEMIEAATFELCRAMIGDRAWEKASEQEKDELRALTRRFLEAAEALRPKMVEVGEKTEEGTGMRHWNVEWATLAGMPIGTRLYAEQPK
jgi:hypothetical protein